MCVFAVAGVFAGYRSTTAVAVWRVCVCEREIERVCVGCGGYLYMYMYI